MVGRILQGLLGAGLTAGGAIGILPLLQIRQAAITMDGILYLGIFLVGLDILGRALRRS